MHLHELNQRCISQQSNIFCSIPSHGCIVQYLTSKANIVSDVVISNLYVALNSILITFYTKPTTFNTYRNLGNLAFN